MKYIELGITGIEVSKLGLGCIDFGTKTDDKTAFELIDTYLELGGNILDTANNYAFWNGGDGRDSEKCMGRYIKSNADRRSDIFLCTKVGARPTDIMKGFPSMQGNSRAVILEEVEKSLDAMNTTYIDLLYLHVDDLSTPLHETMETLDELVKKGYVRNIGCSNFYTWRIEQARQICRDNGFTFFSAIQQRHSYLEPVMDADFDVQVAASFELERYIDYYQDLTMVSFAPLLDGTFCRGCIDDIRYKTVENQIKLTRLLDEQSDPNAWVLSQITEHYGGSVALFTSGSVEHLISNMKGIDLY